MAAESQVYSEHLGLPIFLQDINNWSPNIDLVHGMDNGFCSSGLPFSDQFQQDTTQFQLQQEQSNQNQNSGFDHSNNGASSSCTCNSISISSMQISQSLDAQLQIQAHELDCILHLQSERLRWALLEQRKVHLATLFSSLESKSMNLIRQKEEDLALASRKQKELEDCLRKAEMESKNWQRLAKEKEEMVINLTNKLEHVKEEVVLAKSRAEDTESFCGTPCDCDEREVQEVEMEKGRKKMACKICKFRSSCMVFLPCKHLCCCNMCQMLIDSCPVCKSAKEACLEVFLA